MSSSCADLCLCVICCVQVQIACGNVVYWYCELSTTIIIKIIIYILRLRFKGTILLALTHTDTRISLLLFKFSVGIAIPIGIAHSRKRKGISNSIVVYAVYTHEFLIRQSVLAPRENDIIIISNMGNCDKMMMITYYTAGVLLLVLLIVKP